MSVKPRGMRASRRLAAALGGAAFFPDAAFAHASEHGHVLLLPTGHYLIGGAVAVAASFLALVFLPAGLLQRLAAGRLVLFDASRAPIALTSFLSFLFLFVLILAGILGSRDPLDNPLPLVIWTLVWVALTLVQGLLGNIWRAFNPWYLPWILMSRRLWRWRPDYPARWGYWPAFVLLLAFAWFELIYPAPDDPGRLAFAVIVYWLLALIGMLIFGFDAWCERGEFLSVFYRMISRFAVFGRESEENGGRLAMALPGARTAAAPVLPPSGVAFLLLVLSSVSFDGLSRTFFWLGLIGVNPLEFPGRTAVMGVNTLGLAATFLAFAAVYALAIWIGEFLAGQGSRTREAMGVLIWSIVPIALAYHGSHYLTELLVNGQYALRALSDPFEIGWDLIGTADLDVHAGIVAGSRAAWVVWNLQAAMIIGGHILAVLIAHILSHRLHDEARPATLSQLPLTLLMVGYTVFGLWLLSTPTAG